MPFCFTLMSVLSHSNEVKYSIEVLAESTKLIIRSREAVILCLLSYYLLPYRAAARLLPV